jgi:RNA polymerase sigma-32 factor
MMNQELITQQPGMALDWYLNQVRQFPMLSPGEERRLAELYRDHRDEHAARQLLGSHLRLVVKMARGFAGYGLPLSELIAEGNVGLMQALSKFEPERGFRFSTYAMWWIRAAIQEFILHNRSLVKMGTTAAQKKLFFNLRRLKRDFGELGEGDLAPEVVAKIAKELEVSETQVVEMNRRIASGDASLSAPMGVDGTTEWQDLLAADGPDQEDLVVEASDRAWRRDLLSDGMRVLTERERHILTERRLKDEPLTLEDLSQVYGVSRERIRQIEVRAFEKLQKAMLRAANDQHVETQLAA